MFSAHVGFRSVTVILTLSFTYFWIKLRKEGPFLSFHNGKNIGLRVRRPGIRFQLFLTSSVIYCRNVKRWQGKVFREKINWIDLVWEYWGATVDNDLAWLDSEKLTFSTKRVLGPVVDKECQFIKLRYVGSRSLITRRSWGLESRQPRIVDDFRKSPSAKIASGTSALYREPWSLWATMPSPVFPCCPTSFPRDVLALWG